MNERPLLMIPGPTPVPESVLLAMAASPIEHRSPEFSELLLEITQGLRDLHQTSQDVLILASSGTGAMEAGMINVLSPKDRILCGVNGKFGQRWADLADRFGWQCDRIQAPWGDPYPVNAFADALSADTAKTIKAVVLTHCETSTGVVNDIQAIAALAQAHGEALVIVDAVTSLGAMAVPMDEWGLDIVVSASQKGYRIPAGLGFVAVSQRAWPRIQQATSPTYYWDLSLARQDLQRGTTPFTPAVNLLYGLKTSLQMMQAEGLAATITRHQQLGAATRAGIRALGLRTLAPETAASPVVTAVWAPDGIDAEAIRRILKQDLGIAIAAAQDHLKGKAFRIGHLGYVSLRDILITLTGLEVALATVGYQGFMPGSAVRAAQLAQIPAQSRIGC